MTKEVERYQDKHDFPDAKGVRASGADRPSSAETLPSLGSSFWESKHPILEWDLQVSRSFFNWCQRSKLRKILAEIVTLSGDEALVYPVVGALGFALLKWRANDAMEELAARRLLRIFGDFGAVCVVEAFIKIMLQRPRPPYKAPSKVVCMLGERYSCPSGHSLRAAYAAIIFSGQHGPDFNLWSKAWGLGPELFGLRGLLLLWAFTVGMSRIGLGKHYVSDVLGGWACGIAIAQSSYPLVSPQGWLRTALASVFTLEVLYIAASAQRRSEILGWPFLALIVVLFWITFPFAA